MLGNRPHNSLVEAERRLHVRPVVIRSLLRGVNQQPLRLTDKALREVHQVDFRLVVVASAGRVQRDGHVGGHATRHAPERPGDDLIAEREDAIGVLDSGELLFCARSHNPTRRNHRDVGFLELDYQLTQVIGDVSLVDGSVGRDFLIGDAPVQQTLRSCVCPGTTDERRVFLGGH